MPVVRDQLRAAARDVAEHARARAIGRVQVHVIVELAHDDLAVGARREHVDALEVARELALHGVERTALAEGRLAVAGEHQEAHARSAATAA